MVDDNEQSKNIQKKIYLYVDPNNLTDLYSDERKTEGKPEGEPEPEATDEIKHDVN